MESGSDGIRKALSFLAAAIVILAALAFMGHRAAVTHTVETLYGYILASPPENPGNFPTDEARFERSQKLLAVWRSLEEPTLDLEKLRVALPFPLRLTHTTRVENPQHLRQQASQIFMRDLAALSGRDAAAATLPAWQQELEEWRAAIGR
jgi:hypothetical protein